MKTPTEKLVMALRVLATDIRSEDGVINAALFEASLRLEEQHGRIKHLEHGIAKQGLEIEQTCGKVLGYPWFKDDQKNFPSATEEHGVCVGEHVPETIVSELARKYTEAQQRIKQLEDALTSIGEYWNRDTNERAMEDACWYAVNTASDALEAKEAKL